MSEYTLKQLKEMSPIQLQRLAGQLRHQIQSLSFQVGLNELKQVHKIHETRQTLARVMTLLGRAPVDAKKGEAEAKNA
jgi:ribosomal protein L29